MEVKKKKGIAEIIVFGYDRFKLLQLYILASDLFAWQYIHDCLVRDH